MSDAQLREDILLWLRSNARGAEKAKPRRALLVHLCAQGHWPTPNDTADRALRKFKETLPEVGSCLRGYFLIVAPADCRVAEGHLHGKAMSELHREREIREAAPTGQGELWGGQDV